MDGLRPRRVTNMLTMLVALAGPAEVLRAQGAPVEAPWDPFTVNIGEPPIGDQGWLLGTHFFHYADQSMLGGDVLDGGQATHSRASVQYNSRRWRSGVGLFYEKDGFGGDQWDTMTGVLLEVTSGGFYARLMPGFIERQASGLSYGRRSGGFRAIEVGLRAHLALQVLFYEVALQHRTKTFTQEDGQEMRIAYVQTASMPTLGIGLAL